MARPVPTPKDPQLPRSTSSLALVCLALACGACGGKLAREPLDELQASADETSGGLPANEASAPISGEEGGPRRIEGSFDTCSTLEPPTEGIALEEMTSTKSPRGGSIRPGRYVLVRAEQLTIERPERVRLSLYLGEELTFHTAYVTDTPEPKTATFWGGLVVIGNKLEQRGPGCWPKGEAFPIVGLFGLGFAKYTAEGNTLTLFGGERTYTFVRSVE